MKALRVIDSGLRGARANMALGAVLAQGRQSGGVDCLRFFRFPAAILIGRHQNLRAEVDISATHGVELARRLTGGGAVYVDPRQLCWEVVLKTALPLDLLTAQICQTVAAGLSGLGVAAAFSPGNDITVAGRKICGTAGFVDGGVVLLHGTLLLDADIAAMTRVLTPSADKLGRHGAAAIADRVTDLAALLGAAPSFDAARRAISAGMAALGFSPYADRVSEAEEILATRALAGFIGSDAFVETGESDAD